MYTQVLDWEASPSDSIIQKASEVLSDGGVVALPSETVYGLSARIDSRIGIESIYQIKKRPSDNPLIIHIFDLAQLKKIAQITAKQTKQIELLVKSQIWPGALTLILQASKKASIVNYAVSNFQTVAVRMPQNSFFRTLLQKIDIPLAAPSANISGRPSGTHWQTIYTQLNGQIPLIIKDKPSSIGIESTVLDLTQTTPTILRPGKITQQQLQKVLKININQEKKIKGVLKSPGLKYKHYQPVATVVLYKNWDMAQDFMEKNKIPLKKTALISPSNAFQNEGLKHPSSKFYGLKYSSVDNLAFHLYEWFYFLEKNYSHIFIYINNTQEGFYKSVLERLERSAHHILY